LESCGGIRVKLTKTGETYPKNKTCCFGLQRGSACQVGGVRSVENGRGEISDIREKKEKITRKIDDKPSYALVGDRNIVCEEGFKKSCHRSPMAFDRKNIEKVGEGKSTKLSKEKGEQLRRIKEKPRFTTIDWLNWL